MAKINFVYKGRYFVRDTETIGYLSALAKSAGYQTSLVYDPDVFGITDNVWYFPFLNRYFSSEKKLISQVAANKPEMVVLLENFANAGWIKNIVAGIKSVNTEIKLVVISPPGGYKSAADKILTGEPEKVFADFLKVNLSNDILPDKNLWSRFVDFSTSYMVYTSKGCPGNCSYCEETIYKNRFGSGYFRRRTPENVIKELLEAKKKYNPQEIIFKDSVFAIDKKWLRDFLKIYQQEINIPYKCFGKADIFDEEIAALLKESGCYCVEFGVQTLNEKIRKEVLSRRETTLDIKNALAICDKYNLAYDIDHMFGLPTESVSDHKEAAEFYKNLKCLNRIKCHNLVVYPCAKIGEFYPEGSVGDFFAGVAGAKEMKRINWFFEKIFKVLPLMPQKVVKWLIRGNNWRIFRFVPTIFIVFGQVLLALKNRDKRFKVYFRYYPRKVKLALGLDHK